MSKSIYVGNLPFTATVEEVEALFSEHGTVEQVTLVTDRKTGRPRGHGFVVMTDEVDAYNAIAQLDGQDFGGRPLRASMRLPRGQRPAPGR